LGAREGAVPLNDPLKKPEPDPMALSMNRHWRIAPTGLLSVSLIFGALACSDSPTEPLPVASYEYTPNDTPANTMTRFIELHETKNATEFSKLLAGDFRFEFSSAADPGLVVLYPSGWTRSDERIATKNLFEGGQNMFGGAVEGADSIQLALTPTTPAGDTTAGKDSSLYKTLVSSVEMQVDFASGDQFVVGQAPPQNHRFWLVRGDAAAGLDLDQPADSLHWYLYHWADESPTVKPVAKPEQSNATTWGRIKAVYR
jgi:hypothetical protein